MRGISGPSFSYSEPIQSANEATLRSYLIEPVLTRHLSHLPVKPLEKSGIFTACLTMEQGIPFVGRPAAVDLFVVG